MASVFTYDPSPPRVSSPWLTPNASTPQPALDAASAPSAPESKKLKGPEAWGPVPQLLADCGITRLEAEPQEGPTEYKLHLLLRSRRSFSSLSTGIRASGSRRSASHAIPRRGGVDSHPRNPAAAPPASTLSRQARLEQLTTQLLWRLQQSSPFHASSTNKLVLPSLPEAAPILEAPTRPSRLLPGLEESRGALYEIGVSDDGTFVGLTRDELEESLNNLKAMAASLGCSVEVLRVVVVGDCEWVEDHVETTSSPHLEKLWVAEALVQPDLESLPDKNDAQSSISTHTLGNRTDAASGSSQTEQLRVSLTGATTSGKSSLLGTLSTATLDNGRGKSRLSLLKHRHELASGITSSVAQELVGYRSGTSGRLASQAETEVINYASGNVSSWNDIHSSSESGRLIFLSDSAGHPRYRRTTVRGLVGWAPRWTLLCIAADDSDDSSGKIGGTSSAQEVLGSVGAHADLSGAHLDLCLKLQLPLIVVITKLDLASKAGLRQTLAKLLSSLKAASRKPIMLSSGIGGSDDDIDLRYVPVNEEVEVRKLFSSASSTNGVEDVVPIVLTSAVKGTGISMVHALLRNLPIAPQDSDHSPERGPLAATHPSPPVLFHIEEVYSMPHMPVSLHPHTGGYSENACSILSGHLRHGSLSVGDELIVGPFPTDVNHGEDPLAHANGTPSPRFSTPRLKSSPRLSPRAISSPTAPIRAAVEWRRARILSIRNLRLPVSTLVVGQVGTVGISILPEDDESQVPSSLPGVQSLHTSSPAATVPSPRVRRGMILARFAAETHPQAFSTFTALFDTHDASCIITGALVVVYIASVRASARVVQIRACSAVHSHASPTSIPDDSDEVFGFEDDDDNGHGDEIFDHSMRDERHAEITFQFVAGRDWVELGSQVLVMPGGGRGFLGSGSTGSSAGLEGFVGKVSEACG
ncbi:MAG: hypothetical protein M1819_002724 [Sarea resinae]|nr:MAG: hypothetical protein M1819_002724 [Sarea resinae]